MKLARFGDDRIGIVRDDVIVDVTEIAGAASGEWPPVAMNRLIANFAELKRKLESAARGQGVALAGVRLLTPVPWPSKVVAYPVNYHDHGAEMRVGYRANNQGFFLKPPSSISGPSDPIVLPVNAGRRIDHECELAVIIGREGRDIPRERTRNYVFGYSCLIDAVIRGKEERVARKAFDTFCPVGPWIVTADAFDPANVALRCTIDGAPIQEGRTSSMRFGIAEIVGYVSQHMELRPGDLIATGTPPRLTTPPGPERRLRAGDTVTVSIEGIGRLTTHIA